MIFSKPLFLISLLSLLLLLYIVLRRPRREKRVFSQVFLFLRARRETLSRISRWQFLKNLILILEAFFLLFLSLSASAPQGVMPPWAGKYCAVVLDTSLSMMATDVAPNRFVVAVSLARKKIEELLSSGNQVSFWELSLNPKIIQNFTSNTHLLESALDKITPSYSGTNIMQLLDLLEKWAAPKVVEVYLFSDLAFSVLPNRFPHLVLHQIGVGEAVENLAIVSANLQGERLWLEIKNFGNKEREVHLKIDGKRVENPSSFWIENMSTQEVALTVTGTKPYIKVEIEEADPLEWDNALYLIRPQSLRVLLVSSTPFIKSALQALGMTVVSVKPEDYSPQISSDLAIFEDFLPDVLPDSPLLIIHPPQGNKLFTWSGLEKEGFPIEVPSSLVEFLDFSTVQFYEVPVLQPGAMIPIAFWGKTPFLFEGVISDHRAVLFAPSLSLSNFPLEPSFPVFLLNVINYLSGEKAGFQSFEETRSDELLEPVLKGEEVLGSPPGLYLKEGAQGFRFYSCAYLSEEESNLLRHTEIERMGATTGSNAPRDLMPFMLFIPLALILIEEILRRKYV